MNRFVLPKNIVLYADDDPDDLDLVKDAFTQFAQDVEVLTFENGSEAITYLLRLEEHDPTPCLIILDINMPILNGKDTLVRIRATERFASVPVVLFTTSSQPHDQEFARRHNAGFITKPIEFRQMELIADQFVDHCSEETQRRIRKGIF
jgi:CheY-like chemotaxis protein